MTSFPDVKYVDLPAVFALSARYNEDKNPNKVNLTIGAYRNDAGKPWVLPVVRKAESMLAADETTTKEYLSMGGLQSFCDAATRLVLGENSPAILEERAVSLQTLSGTGALTLAFQFIAQFYTKSGKILVSNPSWGNHKLMIDRIPGLEFVQYSYYDQATLKVDLKAMVGDLEKADEGSVVLLHACAHNPTGIDPSKEEWKQIADVCERRGLFPLFDIAYQGYVSGNLEEDAWAVQYFADRGFEMLICQSFAKIMGLYCERVGNMVFVGQTNEVAHKCLSQLKIIVRSIYSNPPAHGARVASLCLNNKDMRAEWEGCVKTMHGRIRAMRECLHTALKTVGAKGNWDHIVNQNGMFSYTGLSKAQCDMLIEKHHIYLLTTGRISMCGLTADNCKYVAESFADVLQF